jgi:hypothetical protein
MGEKSNFNFEIFFGDQYVLSVEPITFAALTVFSENTLALRVPVLETASINASRCESKSALPLFPALYEIAYFITKKLP